MHPAYTIPWRTYMPFDRYTSGVRWHTVLDGCPWPQEKEKFESQTLSQNMQYQNMQLPPSTYKQGVGRTCPALQTATCHRTTTNEKLAITPFAKLLWSMLTLNQFGFLIRWIQLIWSYRHAGQFSSSSSKAVLNTLTFHSLPLGTHGLRQSWSHAGCSRIQPRQIPAPRRTQIIELSTWYPSMRTDCMNTNQQISLLLSLIWLDSTQKPLH